MSNRGTFFFMGWLLGAICGIVFAARVLDRDSSPVRPSPTEEAEEAATMRGVPTSITVPSEVGEYLALFPLTVVSVGGEIDEYTRTVEVTYGDERYTALAGLSWNLKPGMKVLVQSRDFVPSSNYLSVFGIAR